MDCRILVLLSALWTGFAPAASSAEVSYASLRAFQSSLKEIKPGVSPGLIGRLLDRRPLNATEAALEPVAELMAGESRVVSTRLLWQGYTDGKGEAVMFARSRPKSRKADGEVGVVFLLRLEDDVWRVRQWKRFTVDGPSASVSCELVNEAHRGVVLGRPIFTVTRKERVRGELTRTRESYKVQEGDFQPLVATR